MLGWLKNLESCFKQAVGFTAFSLMKEILDHKSVAQACPRDRRALYPVLGSSKCDWLSLQLTDEFACRFIRALSGSMSTLTQLLASPTLSDVTETVTLLVCCDKFGVTGSEAALRQMLPLIFSREQGAFLSRFHQSRGNSANLPATCLFAENIEGK